MTEASNKPKMKEFRIVFKNGNQYKVMATGFKKDGSHISFQGEAGKTNPDIYVLVSEILLISPEE